MEMVSHRRRSEAAAGQSAFVLRTISIALNKAFETKIFSLPSLRLFLASLLLSVSPHTWPSANATRFAWCQAWVVGTAFIFLYYWAPLANCRINKVCSASGILGPPWLFVAFLSLKFYCYQGHSAGTVFPHI
jgi:hypothetical protein